MIPYFELTVIPLGPVRIQVWGLFVVLGTVTAVILGAREARRRGLNAGLFIDLAGWSMLGAIVAARLVHAFAYEPAAFIADPLRLLRLWEGGMSGFGGFLGAAAAAAVFVFFKKIDFLRYADVAAYYLPLGYGIGRIGCFFVHDHPGVLSDLFFAVDYPGGPRLDHGLLLSLLGFAVFGIFALIKKYGRGPAKPYLAMFMLLYGPVRFLLDFYRAWDIPEADVRYFLLTPAQYGSAVMIILGAVLLRLRLSRRMAALVN